MKDKTIVYGIGYRENMGTLDVEGKTTKEYGLWKSILFRCTEKCSSVQSPYIGCTISENFKSYDFFYEWYRKQKGYGFKDNNGRYWQIDKDIIERGNKIYHEDLCVLVPHSINTLLTRSDRSRGEYPIGVTKRKDDGRFYSCCSDGTGKQKFLGRFGTPEDAFLAYKYFKEKIIAELANKYKEVIDPRAYQALINYRVEITD